MKTLLTAAFVAALACTGAAFSQDKNGGEPAPRAPGKKFAIEDLRPMLEAMGFQPQDVKNKEGKLIGFEFRYETDDVSYMCRISIGTNGKTLFFDAWFNGIDENTPTAAILKLLELNDAVWPATITYGSANKLLGIWVGTPADNVTPAVVRNTLNTHGKAVKTALRGFNKALEEAKKKSKDPNPLP